MVDVSRTIEAKSDQLNADDLIGSPRTVKITKVSADTSSTEQPIVINYEGDNGKPFKPCKTVRRLLVGVWGSSGLDYVGRSMTLYRDSSVKWGGMEVGGIRVSHMSHIDKPVTIALTATRGNKKPVTIKPLTVNESSKTAHQESTHPQDRYAEYAREFGRRLKEQSWEAVDSWFEETAEQREGIDAIREQRMKDAIAAKIEKETGA